MQKQVKYQAQINVPMGKEGEVVVLEEDQLKAVGEIKGQIEEVSNYLKEGSNE